MPHLTVDMTLLLLARGFARFFHHLFSYLCYHDHWEGQHGRGVTTSGQHLVASVLLPLQEEAAARYAAQHGGQLAV